ncbi:MAG: hypothetical protein PHU97_09880 [Bacteroidales bacterium]|nr:hypothetical protein [Bacteroidales bacterium]MDD3011611.1 hypothetical protein [Bacteroidales bacterium]MDD3962558.1 hypothetical protein [Bacteroidales bacterium]MDY0285973.1 hypothetical protein [Bacteroidales bacterium]HPE85721.1 hypothetical protein [Bacteroidales bacterium]
MKKNNIQEQLERYLKGVMTAKEMKQFESLLVKDNSLFKEIALEQELTSVLQEEDILDLKHKLDALRRPNRKTIPLLPVIEMMRSNLKYVAAAAGMGVLITAGVLSLTPRSYTADKLFKMYYQPDKALIVNRSGRGNVNIVEALMKFQKKEFEAASQMFEQILVKESDNIALRFYSGISYIETEKYDKAIEAFNYIIENNDNLYVEHAEWYLALCYLKQEKTSEARIQLLRIANEEDGFYKADAEKILEKLEQ